VKLVLQQVLSLLLIEGLSVLLSPDGDCSGESFLDGGRERGPQCPAFSQSFLIDPYKVSSVHTHVRELTHSFSG